MQIGIPAEIVAGETQWVAATPETVKKLTIAAGNAVVVQAGAGVKASVPDADYVGHRSATIAVMPPLPWRLVTLC